MSVPPCTQSFLIHLSGTDIYLLSGQQMFLSKSTKPARKGLSEWVSEWAFFHNNFQRLSSHPCLPAHGEPFVAGDGEAPGKSGCSLALMLGPDKDAACTLRCLLSTFPARRVKPLGNHLFSSCCPSAWEADWQLKGEGPEAMLIVWGPCSNMDGERGGPCGWGKNGNLCEAWHSKCHLCEDLDLLRSVFNNLGCSGLFLFPLSPKAPLPPLFLPHERALFQSGSNPFSMA